MSYSFKKQLKSFTFAWKGILTCAGHEQNITFHLIAAIIVLAAGFCFGISRTEWMVVMLCIGTVIAAELFNSAIERLVDMVSPEWEKIAGEVKDIAAGAVLVTAIAAAIVGIIVFLPYVIALF
ncbi:MAG: diacylglycerol kinase family protein [Bacteroidaceae bacterium]|nr:diacylglycerol kinase family protein [Bacteroidaceae bacterium]MBP3833005.1 diacylglycerol kinase family protein [Bacteroidaceae bacterium]MBQ8484940.1 diacylglycerol kinase family protein [Bacteroidaceae bacterium]